MMAGLASWSGAVLIGLFFCLALAQRQGIFGPIDSEQVDRMLSDQAFVQKQIKCIMGKGTCDQIGKQLKIAIPEVLIRQCRSCNKQQSENARKVIKFIQENYPQEWSVISAKYSRRVPL